MGNQIPPAARLGVARAILEFIVIVFYFCIVLLITPIWLILVICQVNIGNPWRWLDAKWKMANGDYEGAARIYEEDAERISDKYDLSDEDEEDEELRKEFIEVAGEPDEETAPTQLLKLAQNGYFSEPEYDYYEDEDINGNTEWECTITIYEYSFDVTKKTRYKRDVKKMCAYEMYKEILKHPND